MARAVSSIVSFAAIAALQLLALLLGGDGREEGERIEALQHLTAGLEVLDLTEKAGFFMAVFLLALCDAELHARPMNHRPGDERDDGYSRTKNLGSHRA